VLELGQGHVVGLDGNIVPAGGFELFDGCGGQLLPRRTDVERHPRALFFQLLGVAAIADEQIEATVEEEIGGIAGEAGEVADVRGIGDEHTIELQVMQAMCQLGSPLGVGVRRGFEVECRHGTYHQFFKAMLIVAMRDKLVALLRHFKMGRVCRQNRAVLRLSDTPVTKKLANLSKYF
jgi:hypothetical protein